MGVSAGKARGRPGAGVVQPPVDHGALGLARETRRWRGAVSCLSGAAAEGAVARAYLRAGYRLLAERWRGQSGEIDLIFDEGQGLVFVEVKAAKELDKAALSLGARQRRRIVAAASEYLAQVPGGLGSSVRFDLAMVDGVGRVRVLENAFGEF